MRYPQLLVYETDGLLASTLRPLAENRKWILREPRQTAACLRLLRRAHPAVLVIKVGTDMSREMNLLERIRWLRPEAFTVVVLGAANPPVAALAWHAGATYVLAPPQPRKLGLEPALLVAERSHGRQFQGGRHGQRPQGGESVAMFPGSLEAPRGRPSVARGANPWEG